MPLSDEILSLCREAIAQGIPVTFTPDGGVFIGVPPVKSGPMSNAEKCRSYRQRKTENPTPNDTKRHQTTPNDTAKVSLLPETDTVKVSECHEIKAAPSPPPSPPTPSPSAPTPTGGRRERAQEEAADFAAACAVTLDMTADAELRKAWLEWQTYRQARHKLTGTRRKPWTLQSANASATRIMRAVELHGTQIVVDRITQAIADGWQGLNFDKLPTTPPNGPKNFSRNPGPPPPSSFKSFRAGESQAPANLTPADFYR